MEGIENLEIMQWNARSINKNGPDLTALFTTHRPHIVAIQETWLTEKIGFLIHHMIHTE